MMNNNSCVCGASGLDIRTETEIIECSEHPESIVQKIMNTICTKCLKKETKYIGVKNCICCSKKSNINYGNTTDFRNKFNNNIRIDFGDKLNLNKKFYNNNFSFNKFDFEDKLKKDLGINNNFNNNFNNIKGMSSDLWNMK